ncbi:NADAR family protein [Asticcacaulis solisilvae]|uniref:NADAR family protein n=1 Tax=Asticcacaulis solisilvae TaxID=1217274 RepID=UPI003FD8C70E
MTVYFYSQTDAFAEFSNFAPFGIEMDGVWWKTVEHYFQAQKFDDAAWRERIRKASTPKDAKALGRTRDVPIRAGWDDIRNDVMLAAVRKKFSTHKVLAELLLGTGEEDLAEAAPGDYYWGIGADGSGENRLGRMLEQVRAELKA